MRSQPALPERDGHGNELLNADQLAARLGKDRRWVYRQVEYGLPALQLGRALLFRAAEVDAWLESHRVRRVAEEAA